MALVKKDDGESDAFLIRLLKKKDKKKKQFPS